MSTSVTVPAPAPAQNKFVSFLDHLGTWFKTKFQPVEKEVETVAVAAATVAEPFVAVADPSIVPLYNTTLQVVTQLQAAADNAQGAGAAKMASAVATMEPIAIPYLKSIGVANPTTAQVQAWIQSVVDGLKAFQVVVPAAAPSAPAAAPAATN